MSELNNPGCVLVGANTGIPDCAFIPDKFVGAILVPKKAFDINKTNLN